jgi:deoxycytidylate deaminase
MKWENRIIEMARALMPKQLVSDHNFHCTFILEKNKIVKIGVNNYNKLHSYHKFGYYYPTKRDNCKPYQAGLHSEVAAIIRLGEEDCSDYIFVNIRLGVNGELRMAKPCSNCQRVLNGVGFKRLYYSTETGFEEWIQ